jgi:hypothetical protein
VHDAGLQGDVAVAVCHEAGGNIGEQALNLLSELSSFASASPAERAAFTTHALQCLHATNLKGVANDKHGRPQAQRPAPSAIRRAVSAILPSFFSSFLVLLLSPSLSSFPVSYSFRLPFLTHSPMASLPLLWCAWRSHGHQPITICVSKDTNLTSLERRR